MQHKRQSWLIAGQGKESACTLTQFAENVGRLLALHERDPGSHPLSIANKPRRVPLRRLWRPFADRHAAIRALLVATFVLVMSTLLLATSLLGATLRYIYFDRTNLPDIEAFVRLDCPAIGHVYDEKGVPLAELSREHRRVIQPSPTTKAAGDVTEFPARMEESITLYLQPVAILPGEVTEPPN